MPIAATRALEALVSDQGADAAFVVILDAEQRPLRAFRWAREDGHIEAFDIGEPTREKIAKAMERRKRTRARLDANRGPADPGRFGVVAGGGLLLNGAHRMGAVTARLDFRLVDGFELGLGAHIGLSETELHQVVLPLVTLDARYRFLRGPAHLYLGGRGLLGFTNSESDLTNTETFVIGGVAGLVGVEFSPRGDKGFTLFIEAAGGALRQASSPDTPRLHLTVTGGAGFRL